MRVVTLIGVDGACRALVSIESERGLVKQMRSESPETINSHKGACEHVVLIGQLPGSIRLDDLLQQARNITFRYASEQTIRDLLPRCKRVQNLEFDSCIMPPQISTRSPVNLTLRACEGTYSIWESNCLGITLCFPLVEPLSRALVENAVSAFLNGADGLTSNSYMRRSLLEPLDVEIFRASNSLIHLSVRDLELSAKVLATVLRLGIRQLSLRECVVTSDFKFEIVDYNDTIDSLELEVDGLTEQALALFMASFRGLKFLEVRGAYLDSEDLGTFASMTLESLDLSSCLLESPGKDTWKGIKQLTLSSAQVSRFPELAAQFAGSQIQIVDTLR